MKQPTQTEDISDLFTKEGIQKLKKGQLLRFNFEGSLTELIITYINKPAHKVRAKHAHTYSPNEVQIHDKDGKETEFTEA